MFPQFNSNPYNPNNRPQINGADASTPQQVMGNQSNLFPNLMQFQPPFQVGMPNQLVVSPFTNPCTQFPPNQAFPFSQGGLQNFNANHLALLLAQNAVNMPQFSPNVPNALQSLLQNANQILQMQMSNFNPQSLGLLMNAPNGTGMGQQPLDVNGLRNMFPNTLVATDFGSSQQQGNPHTFSPSTAANAQDKLAPSEGNGRSSWIKSHSKNLVGSHKHNPSQRGYGNKQFDDQQNMKGNSKFDNINQDKGKKNTGLSNFNPSSNQNQAGKKRSLTLTYTEKEIRQWREERRKNFPSTSNLEKKLKENITQQETADAKIRRQQLKEILAKQSELGCPVAEVPSQYLSDSEVPKNSRRNDSANGKRQKFGNKFNEERKFQRNGRFHKRQGNNGSTSSQNQNDDSCKPQTHGTGPSTNQLAAAKKKEPYLLKKLLSSDIKKDKNQLLQTFRFMVMNSFFEHSPEKPLKFPTVIVKESGDESGVVDNKHQGNGVDPTGLASTADGGSDDSCGGEGD